ncbi:unnamed protein product [Trichogramma brassicae]|uniref:Uncharacterized protein n=1 Tax=Trichogramma brassicae TaxID=86971 RepID=A0A6H5HZT9_9HYME|nr:unnamed protein product [Trichogramma brassicae]
MDIDDSFFINTQHTHAHTHTQGHYPQTTTYTENASAPDQCFYFVNFIFFPAPRAESAAVRILYTKRNDPCTCAPTCTRAAFLARQPPPPARSCLENDDPFTSLFLGGSATRGTGFSSEKAEMCVVVLYRYIREEKGYIVIRPRMTGSFFHLRSGFRRQRGSSTSAPGSLPERNNNNEADPQQQVSLAASSRGRNGSGGGGNYRVNFNVFIFLCYAALTVITYTVADYLLELAWPKGGCGGCSLRYVYRN